MLTVVFLSLLLGSAPNDGSPALSPLTLDAPPVVDESPTAWSCTVDTLRAGKECVFEAELTPAEPNREQAASNVRTLLELGRALCAEAAKARAGEGKLDRNLASTCERKYQAAAEERCGLEGKTAVVDTQGRFAPDARACYRALAGVLQETQMAATVGKTPASTSKPEPQPNRGAASL